MAANTNDRETPLSQFGIIGHSVARMAKILVKSKATILAYAFLLLAQRDQP
jgi:hypothetical protein